MNSKTPCNFDRNLLFGILAVQVDFISREQLMAATSKWLNEKSSAIEDILVELNAIDDAQRAMLQPLVQRHIDNHGGDPAKSLASVSSFELLEDELLRFGDEEIEATLTLIRGQKESGDDLQSTKAKKAMASEGRRFQILRPHAKGGLGEVYVAEDMELRREVALKEIQSNHADDPNSRNRFVLEAEVTGGLEHPGIVPVYGLGQYENGRPFYAMRFIKGDSLKEAADRFHQLIPRPLFDSVEFRQLIGRFVDVCNAISYAHSRGVLHRDLKPGNIMLGKYGETLVVDWGLAKVVGRSDASVEGENTIRTSSGSGQSDSDPTRMGNAIGTPAFMPPEQATGQIDKLGPASDVYSLGATLYYILTGKRPVNGENVAQVLKHVERGEFPAPRSIDAAIPRPLEAICLKAMAKGIADRYETPRLLANDMESWLADQQVSAFDDPWHVRMARWARRHRQLMTAASVFLFSIIVGLIILAFVLESNRKAIASEQAETSKALEKEKKAKDDLNIAYRELGSAQGKLKESLLSEEAARKKIEVENYFNLISLAEKRIEDQEFASASDLLDRCLEKYRCWEWRRLVDLARPTAMKLSGHANPEFKAGNPTSAVDFTLDGKTLVSGAMDGSIVVWNLETKQPVRKIPIKDRFIWSLKVDSGGKQLAVVTPFGGLRLIDLDSGQSVFETSNSGIQVARQTDVVFSADEKSLFVAGRENEIIQIDCQSGKVIEVLKGNGDDNGHRAVVLSLAANTNGELLLSGAADKTAKLWDLKNGKVLKTFVGHGTTPTSVGFGPETNQVFTASGDSLVRIWDVESGKQLRTIKVGSSAVLKARLSPESGILASTTMGEPPRLFDVKTGREISDLAGSQGISLGLAISSDGALIASTSTDGTVRIWDLLKSKDKDVVVTQDGMITSFAFSGDGRRVFSLGIEGTVKVLDTEKLHVTSLDIGDIENSFSLAVPRNGRTFAVNSNNGLDIRDSVSGATKRSILFDQGLANLCFSANGKLVAASPTGQDETIAWDVVSGEERHRFKGRSVPTGAIAFSPKDSHLLTLGTEGTVLVWDLNTGKLIAELSDFETAPSLASFSPDGERVFVVTGNGKMAVFDMSTRKKITTFDNAGANILGLSIHESEPRVLTVDLFGNAKLWDELTGREIMTLKSPDGLPAVHAVFSPDGDSVAITTMALVSGKPTGRLTLWKP